MENFSGSVYHAVDGKNRIRIPAKFRAKLGDEFYFVARPNGCIGVYPYRTYASLIEKLSFISTSDEEMLKAKRIFMESIEEAKEDEQGRATLPQSFRSHAQITKEILTIGMGDYLEIWSKDEYEKYKSGMSFDEACKLLGF